VIRRSRSAGRALSAERCRSVCAFITLLSLACLSSCSSKGSSGAPSTSATPSANSPADVASAEPRAASRFTEGGLDAALERARTEKKLVVVDLWAPWCDACLAMKAGALSSPRLEPLEKDFVFVALDVDQPASAAFVDRHGVRELPTLAVLDPADERVIALRTGELAIAAVIEMLEGARVDAESERESRRKLARARDLVAKGQPGPASKIFEEVASTAKGALRDEAIDAAEDAMLSAEDYARCAAFAESLFAKGAMPSQPVMAARYWVRCAMLSPADAARERTVALAKAQLLSLTNVPKGLSALDLSDAHALLAELERQGGNDVRARASEERRAKVLEDAARAAKTSLERETFDHERVNALRALGRDDDAVRLLQERTRERPDAYETHGRLGTLLVDLGRAKDAIAPLERAIALGYGAPKLVYMGRLADAYAAVGDHARELSTLETAAEGWDALPKGQQDPARGDAAKKRLSEARRAAD